MICTGLDLNATTARAVSGPDEVPPRALILEHDNYTLPLAISLQNRRPEVGRAGTGLCREWPHLLCHDFLVHLGTSRTWSAGRHNIDASQALSLVLDRLRPACTDTKALALAVPAYLNRPQVAQLTPLVRKARLPLVGSVAAPLAATMTAFAEQAWQGLAVLVDVEDHALSWSVLKVSTEQAQIVDGQPVPELNLRVWKACLLDGIADCCVRHSRRDPRDSGAAEQLLHDQLGDVLEAARQEQLIEVVIRTGQWCQNLILQPELIRLICDPLLQEAAAMLGAAFDVVRPGPLGAVLATAAAGRLPGLVPLLQDAAGRLPVTVLPDEAVAQGAHQLAIRCQRGELPREHHDRVIPLVARNGADRRGAAQRIIPIAAADR
jgi:hypothetical protein